MTEKKKKKLAYKPCFTAFWFIVFLFLSASKVFAAALEVNYPKISNQTIQAGVQLPDYIKYLFNAGMAVGFIAVFISLAVAGIMYFLSPISVDAKADAKDRFSGAISGLLILVTTYLIITTINPRLAFFGINSLPAVTPSPAATKAPGVYFYHESDCSNNRVQPSTSSIKDFGPSLRNKINSVSIVQGANRYISILYDNINFWGKCLYVNGNTSCQSAKDPQTGSSFADSASIYRFDPNPNGDGVYFYRKSYFNDQSGYLYIPNSSINVGLSGGLYNGDLNQLKFTGDINSSNCTVPEDEQDCVKYDANNKCVQRSCPTLAGENISSVKINGNYLVLFVYYGPNDNSAGPWTSCQEFPTPDDVNKTGPHQMKWQNIRNSNQGVIPNHVVIIPIQE